MGKLPNAIDEFHQLRAQAAQTRAQAIRAQIATGFTFTRIVEIEVEYGRLSKGHQVMDKLRKLVHTIHRHLDEEGHLPASEIAPVRSELARLEDRISAVGSSARDKRR
jgi:hypothetical protein